MRLSQTNIPILLLLLVLGASALAAPPVALLRVKTGDATLDGKPINKAQMASNGQKLSLKEGAEVRVMLMDTRSEFMLKGPTSLVLDKTQLSSQAKKVERGEVSVADDIGNLNASAGLRRRTGGVPVNPELPPRKVKDKFQLVFDSGASFTLDSEVHITLRALEPSQSTPLFNQKRGALETIELPCQLQPGVRYELTLEQPRTHHTQTFRLLTEQESEFLRQTGRKLTRQSRKDRSVQPLVQMASLCADLDQFQIALNYIRKANESRYYKPTKLKDEISKLFIDYKNKTQMKLSGSKKS